MKLFRRNQNWKIRKPTRKQISRAFGGCVIMLTVFLTAVVLPSNDFPVYSPASWFASWLSAQALNATHSLKLLIVAPTTLIILLILWNTRPGRALLERSVPGIQHLLAKIRVKPSFTVKAFTMKASLWLRGIIAGKFYACALAFFICSIVAMVEGNTMLAIDWLRYVGMAIISGLLFSSASGRSLLRLVSTNKPGRN